MADDTQNPRTHRWFRREQEQSARSGDAGDRPQPVMSARIPAGQASSADELSRAICAALDGWPIVLLRVTGRVEGKGKGVKLGKLPARWIRSDLLGIVDAQLCSCNGPRCIDSQCTANRLFGRHGKLGKTDGEAWAPFVLRTADTVNGTVPPGRPVSFEIVFAGDATREVGRFAAALNNPAQPMDQHPVRWSTVHALVFGEDRELRWRKVDPMAATPPLLELAELAEPRVRPSRLVLTFLSPTPIARQGERGEASPDLSLALDRMTRSLGAWMGRTGHRGPRLPVDDILRAASDSKVRSDHRRSMRVPDALLSAPGAREAAPRERASRERLEDEGTTALTGSITWTGDFVGLAPLLRAVHYLGMGPGRQHGLGQVAIR
ncbi:MAG: CRISPR system precrRNA processing endoribonuclease RAMP protein Cas6 [Myxococcota bacterium]|nr:CRISPR system precrRNA processing endoribonuclease RAMP protein Cas6 [Myxococcota bacterium]